MGVHTTLGRDHDAGIVDEDIKTLVGGQECLYCGLDGAEVGEIELQEGEVTGAIGGGCADVGDGGLGFGGGAACYVDGGIMSVEDLAEFETYACIAACYDENLQIGISDAGMQRREGLATYSARLVRAVLLRKSGGWDEVELAKDVSHDDWSRFENVRALRFVVAKIE